MVLVKILIQFLYFEKKMFPDQYVDFIKLKKNVCFITSLINIYVTKP